MNGKLFVSHIQRFSSDDGPGIRTTVFLKGCNLRCKWCHNPECIDPRPTIMKRGSREETVGRWYGYEELLEVLSRDRIYYRSSGGGVTFSGGEPLLQYKDLTEALKLCRDSGFTTCVDTAGNVDFTAFEAVMPYTDIFLYDIKAGSEECHLRGTGVSMSRIRANLAELLETIASGRQKYREDLPDGVWIRVPVIPGCNIGADPDEEGCLDEIRVIADHLGSLPGSEYIRRVQPLPYHSYGVGKYAAIGLESPTADTVAPGKDIMDEVAEILREKGLPVVVD